MRRTAFIAVVIVFSHLMLCQEFRSTTPVSSNSQLVTVDLSNVSDVSGASITIHNSSGNLVTVPEVSNVVTLQPLSTAAILSQLPITASDQQNAIQAWQFVVSHTFHLCSSGAKQDNGETLDPIRFFGAYGFGCCEQSSQALIWIWRQLGYQARLAEMPFHTIPEIFYGNAWHMLDPDHQVYYLRDDGIIASVEDVIANPELVARTANADGKDPVGWTATEMAQLYAENASSLTYYTGVGFGVFPASTIILRPHESLTFNSENVEDIVHSYWPGAGYFAPSMTSVGSAQFDWMLSFSDPAWQSRTESSAGLGIISDASGSKFIVNNSAGNGYLMYKQGSPFPVSSLVVSAQVSSNSSGSLRAYFFNGSTWSNAVSLQTVTGQASFGMSVDLTSLARGYYSYYVKIELVGGVQLHKLRITPTVQTAKGIFPTLTPGSTNQLSYHDESPLPQGRAIKITTAVPADKHLIPGVHAESLIPESPTYSLAMDYGAANLVDGDPDSLAYPGSNHLDYVIQLNGFYHVTGLSIDWGSYGSDSRYVQKWQILGRSADQAWQQLASGGLPGQATTDVSLNGTVTELRLVADSANWAGIYDVRVFGNAAEPPIPSNMLSAQSNVPENPTYSVAMNYGAANLVDGNPGTLAYPASTILDYVISLHGITHVSSALITWGYYGVTPNYIQNWSLLGRNGEGQAWSTLAQGGFPNSQVTSVDFDMIATELRLVASSSVNWIGVYDVQISGSALLQNLAATANMQEVPNSEFGAAPNIIDGDPLTDAYPGSASIDYTIDPGQAVYIDSAKISWDHFGTDVAGAHIESWRLLGLALDGYNWEVVSRGEFPNSAETIVPVKNRYRKLRVAAESKAWIGIGDFQAFGAALPTTAGFTVKSNVTEDPTYSISQGYQASNLIDGNIGTLAYPASSHVDYQLSSGAPIQLSQAVINWGYFGTSPVYVQSWSIMARAGANQPWVTLTGGGFPNSTITIVNLDYAATDVRIVADSANWIGLFELQLKGMPLQ
jgi:hypothetical protein